MSFPEQGSAQFSSDHHQVGNSDGTSFTRAYDRVSHDRACFHPTNPWKENACFPDL